MDSFAINVRLVVRPWKVLYREKLRRERPAGT